MSNAGHAVVRVAREALVAVLVAAIAFGPAALPAAAGPEGFDPRVGGATLNQVDATHWEITAPDGSVIQYSSFDIAINEAVRFIQPGQDARVLNRILSALPTRIEGSLTGNGHIYIVNPAGVIFGEGATVNANGIHAAGGHLSDENFASRASNGTVQDHYTGVVGDVTNAGEIVARAVSLVGEHVVNSGQVLAQDGWIVIAAGNDVIIGRETATEGGRGLLLRVEGAAGAVFDADATGVANTGTLDASAGGNVSVGAGDLYGTAIFSNSAIRAREIALAAGNRGDIALAQEVSAEQVDVSFRGTGGVGELRSAVEGETVTVRADEVALSAAGNGAAVRVSDDVAFRSQGDAALGPNAIALEQTATVASAQLAALDVGSAAPGVTREIALRSTGGNVLIDDKAVVAGSDLALSGTLADIRGTDALQVASLAVTGNARSAGDLVASSGDIAVTGSLELVTKPTTAGDPPPETLVSAHQGALDVDGNVSTTAGGGLRIEAREVELGTTIDADPNDATPPVPSGGSIVTRGDLRIGFTDAGGVEQTQTVVARTIDTRGASQQDGGNVDISASGDITLGAISTLGGGGSVGQPNRDGGSVSVRSTGSGARLTVGAIGTGGAESTTRGAIELEAATVELEGSLSAAGGSATNRARDRAVMIAADTLELDADALAIAGSDLDLGGAMLGAEVVPETGPATRRHVDLSLSAAGATNLRSSAELRSLAIASTGGPVVLGGDVSAENSVRVGFTGSGTGALSSAGAPVTVRANRVELLAADQSTANGSTAQVAVGDGIGFDLFAIPATETAAEKPAALLLAQDAAIDGAAASRLVGITTSDSDLAYELRSNSTVTLDAAARAAVAGTDLTISARSFVASGATQSASDFALSSLVVSTSEALDVDFGVTAESVRLAGGLAGDGDLTLRSALRADTVVLAAGNGPAATGSDSRVLFGTGASLRSAGDASAPPTRVELIQDAALDSAALPDLDVFGGSVAGMEYALQSRDSAITLGPGASEKFAGSALELRGQTGVDLGDEALSIASLSVDTAAALRVSQRIDATAPDGRIRLHAGSDGSGDLAIDARLAANTIELVAGSGNGTDSSARILLEDGARFSGSASDARPDHFAFEQDAAIGVAPGSPLPGLDVFGGDIADMAYTLRSNGSSLRIDDTSLVNGTTLVLEGDTGVDVNGDLAVAGLDVLGATTLSGDVASSGDVLFRSALTLDGADAQRDQSISAGAGDLTALGTISKTGAGALAFSGQVVELQAVTTGRTGDALAITGVERVKTGAIDASGAVGARGGDVTISAAPGTSTVEITSIRSRGGSGVVSTTAPENGYAGGAVSVTGQTIAIGSVDSSGGNASAIATSTTPLTRTGGNAGAIVLDGDVVTMNGGLEARGGTGSANDPNAVGGLRGAAADVSVLGAILLGSSMNSATTNQIYGDDVVVAGGVSRAANRALGETGFVVVGESSLSIGGNLTADRIDLEVRSGDLELAADGVSEIRANTLRLAATDGNGGATDGEVDLSGLTFRDEAGTDDGSGPLPPGSFTIEQDFSIGGAGSPLPPMGGENRTVALISHDGAIELDGPSEVTAGTRLTLAANGVAGSTEPAIRVSGGLVVAGLSIGSTGGTSGAVDGDAHIDGDLVVGVGGLTSRSRLLDVAGEAVIEGNATFAGTGDQTLRVGPGEALSFGGSTITKFTGDDLTLDADEIRLTRAGSQTIENQVGQLVIGSENGTGLLKGTFDASGNPVRGSTTAGLTLRGSAAPGTGPAITVRGTREIDGDPGADGRDHAIAVADGDLVIDARAITTGSTTAVPPATWSVDGDVLAHGDVTLQGRGVFAGGRDDYAISARRAAQTSVLRGGELRIAGLAGADGDVQLYGQGDPQSGAAAPSGVLLSGDYDLAHDLTLSGVTEIAGATVIRTAGDLVVESSVVGPSSLAIESARVLFTSSDETQSIQAGSLSFGSSAGAPAASPSVFRDGDLQLAATNGDVQFANGQQLIVAGDLDVDASNAIVLADTAALSIDLNAPVIQGRGGTSVIANQIHFSNRPTSTGGAGTFAAPTLQQLTGNVAGADALLRQIASRPVELTYAQLVAGDIPSVTGPAYFDFATQVPRFARPASIVRPRVDSARMAELREDRPLWADELLFYLDARSRGAQSATEQGALPPVSAGPNATTPDTAREAAADPAVEQAIAPYRALFRPDPEIDPESGIVQGEDRAPEIRAAFERAVQAAAGGSGAGPTAAQVAAAIERDPALADARGYRAGLEELIAAANHALDAEQQVRFRERLLARVAPSGMSAAEFSALIP